MGKLTPNRARRVPRRRAPKRTRHAAELLPIAGLGRDGLLVRTDGALVRYLEVIPSNPLVMGETDAKRMTHGFSALLGLLPAAQTVQLYVEATPVRLGDLLARCRAETERATRPLLASPEPGLRSRGEALARLAAAHAESLRVHAADHAAVELRYVAVIPWRPDLPAAGAVGELRLPARRRPGSVLARTAAAHARLARESLGHADALRGELDGLDLTARLMDGPAVADLLWRRLAPHQAQATPGLAPSRGAARLLGSLEHAHDQAAAAQAAGRLVEEIASAAVDFDADPRWARVDGGLEQTVHLSGLPEQTFYGWTLHAMQSPKPWTLSVHLQALDRHAERAKAKQASRRLFGVNRGAAAAGKMPDYDQLDHEAEAVALVGELSVGNQRLYRMAIYESLREPGPTPDPVALSEAVDQAVRELAAPVDGRAARGEFDQERLWRSTLPLGLDVARKQRKVIARNAADTVPFVGTSCGSPGGIPFAYADPGRTVEQINPRDPLHDQGTLIVCAKSGGGKTMTVINLVSAALPRGAQANVIDRAGHYAPLCAAVPGAAHLAIGADEHTVNPWDTDDVAAVASAKITFLERLHALLIGDHDAGEDAFGLPPLERSLLGLAIRGVYTDAALTGDVPCESALQAQLFARGHAETGEGGSPESAAVYRSLAERLHPFCGDGAYGYLLDRPTTVGAEDAPLVVFDTRAVPDDVSPAVLFCLAEFITGRIERRWERFLAARLTASEPAGLFEGTSILVLEELWKLTERRATGAWINELARRARHLGLFLICISQQRSDLAGTYGRALLNNSTMQLFLRQSADELDHIADALKLSDQEVELIAHLKTEKRRFAQAYFLNGTRGRGTVSIRVGPRIYWLATSEPHEDVPARERALHDTGGDLWAALDLLSDPAWHEAQAA